MLSRVVRFWLSGSSPFSWVLVIAFIASLPETKALETFRQLRALLRSNLGITVDELVLVKSNEIPKTSSGKLQRYKLMQRYLNAEFMAQTLTADKLET